jgi:predicted phage tail protein
MKDGKPLPVKDCEVQVTDNKVIFKIKKPARGLSGPYQVRLANGQGEDVKDVQITMTDLPTPPQDLEVREVFEESCGLKWKRPVDDGGVPILKYVIEKQDLTGKSGWEVAKEIPGDKECRVKIEDLTPKKQYKFRVKAVNKLGAGEPVTLKNPVLAKNPWDEPGKPKDVEVVDWDVDHADLKWTKPDSDGGAPITGYIIEFKEKFAKNWSRGADIPANTYEGTVPDLKEGSQYEFRIRAVNKAGYGEPSDATKPIIAKCRFVKPFIIGEQLTNLIVKKGQVIKYDIKFGGEPEPEVKWEKDSFKELIEDTEQRTTIDKYERNSVLTVRRTVRADSGLYKIILTNSSGTVESVADVIVLDRPSPPKGPLEAVEIRADHAKVKWNKPTDAGGCAIVGYVLEKMDLDTGRWVPAGECGPEDTDFTVKGLTKGKKYKFRVKAINKEGESDPLEMDDSIMARNPYDEPGAPGKPEIYDYDNKSVTLRWEKPDADGGRPITHYTIEMKNKFQPDWLEIAKTENDGCELKVEELKEKMVYQFRVRAHNKAGPSKPSEPTDNHLCKHRYCKHTLVLITFYSNFDCSLSLHADFKIVLLII